MPVYKDKVRGTWFYEGSFINIFGESERYKKRGFQSSTLAKEAERNFLISAKNLTTKHIKFEQLVNLFLEYKKSRIKPRSLYDYQKTIEKQLTPFFGGMYVDKINVRVIEKWQEELLTKNYSNSYLETIQTKLSLILNFAVRKGIIQKNPFDYLEQVKDHTKPKPIMKYWTLEEFTLFINVIDDFEDKLLFDLLYWTGMRISELQARTWEDIDFKTKTLSIHSNFDNKLKKITATPKNGTNRIIFIQTSLIERMKLLKQMQSNIDGFNDACYMFGVFKPISHKTVENKKNKYIKECNRINKIKIPEIRIHDFRHSHVSLLANRGLDSLVIAERLGHSKDMVEKRYSHMFPETRKKVLNILEDY